MDINDYGKELVASDLERNEHREFVGGLWDELGEWQLELMRGPGGLRPEMTLLDVGCGCLRGGVRFMDYLAPMHYYGIDVNASLVHAGLLREVPAAGLEAKCRAENFSVCADFDASRFNIAFDRAISVSLWTHLPLNHIALCLGRVSEVLKPGGRYYATVFEATDAVAWASPAAQRMGIVSYPAMDPYHVTAEQLQAMIEWQRLPLQARRLADDTHPRGQRVWEFEKLA
jgi:SAM-dependent methyltransferase